MSYREIMARQPSYIDDSQFEVVLKASAVEIAARADARIAELETAMKRQAAAVKMLDMSHVARAETMMQHAQVLYDQSNTAALESERAANALLTERIAELEQAVVIRDTEVARLETDLELARIGARRYETARRMNVPMWKDALKLNLSTGKPFDEIIDELRPFMFPQDATRAGNGESGDASPVLDAQYLKSRLAKDLEIIRNNQLPTRR